MTMVLNVLYQVAILDNQLWMMNNSYGLCILDLETLFAIFYYWDCLEFFLKSEIFELLNSKYNKRVSILR